MNQKILALVLVLALAISAMTLTAFAYGPQDTCQETCTVCSHHFENGVCTDCGTVCGHIDSQTRDTSAPNAVPRNLAVTAMGTASATSAAKPAPRP